MDQGKVASTDQRLGKHITDGVDLGVQGIVGVGHDMEVNVVVQTS
jgi:hypothetical protein